MTRVAWIMLGAIAVVAALLVVIMFVSPPPIGIAL